jgi:hypothetical protein
MPTLCRSHDKFGFDEGTTGVAIRRAADSEALGRDRHFTDGINGVGAH